MRRRILAAVVAAASAAAFLACGDETTLSGPSDRTKAPSTSSVAPTNPVVQRPANAGLGPNFLFIVFPGDSTTDPCFGGEFCGVQRRAAGGVAAIFCPNGPGTCPTRSYSWSIENPPANTTTTFNPQVTVTGQQTTFLIQTDSTTTPGTYEPRIVSRLVDDNSVNSVDTIPVRIRCNLTFKSCPEIEIVDLTKGPDSVISAPKPKQITLIGKHVKLGLRWKPGTGTGTYSLVQVPAAPPPYQWSLSGTIIKSYDITVGRLDSLRIADRQADTVSYYYARAASTNSVYAVATLMRDDNRQVSFPEATASYDARGPTSVTMASTTTPLGVAVGSTRGDTSRTWLSFGDPISTPTAGIQFSFTATAPAGDSGYIAGTQLVNSQTTSTPPVQLQRLGGRIGWMDARSTLTFKSESADSSCGRQTTVLEQSCFRPIASSPRRIA
jgi:hypothetical protein